MSLNITLMHCYSDLNRGDAGIIESIVDMIDDEVSGCNFNAISVFHEDDERFESDHFFTKNIVSGIFPPLFTEPNVQENGKGYSFSKKLLSFIVQLFRNFILLVFPYRFIAKLLFTKKQLATFDLINDSDYIISKGGSFLYSLHGLKGEFFLSRMLFAFLLPIRMGKKVCIFSQSLGPFENQLSKRLLFFIVKRLHRVYLREAECKKFLPVSILNKVRVIPDAAFYMKPEEFPMELSGSRKVAITARPHIFSTVINNQRLMYGAYIDCLVVMANHCMESGMEVHLIGQVAGPSKGEDDREALKLIFDKIGGNENVYFWREETQMMKPKQLQYVYSKMDLVIGTRLHSSIFSLAAGTPSINISYHGTKSEGIMDSVGLKEYVMDIADMDAVLGIKLIDKIMGCSSSVSEVNKAVEGHRNDLSLAVKSLLNLG